MVDAIRADNSGPTISTRNLAILHTAIFDAVNSIARTHQSYRFQVNAPPGTSVRAAVAGAGHRVMRTLYPVFASQADALLASQRSAMPAGDAVTSGLALGENVANLMIAERSDDGSNTKVPYIPSDEPGAWRRTPPFFRPPTTPHWRYVRPFCVSSLEPFLPGPPPALNSPEYARDLEEVRLLGAANSELRTADQSEIAVFWSDFSYTSMPPGHWHEIATDIALQRGNTLLENARLFALLSLAQADAAIVCWEVKFRHNLWRPITAIQRADEDGNAETAADPEWNHFLAAPPFPSYNSGHSTFSHASARVLADFYGMDDITFAANSDSLPGVTRTYHSLEGCANEIGLSRIYGGIHFQFDNAAGRRCGQLVGDYVSANFLLPLSSLPLVRLEGFTNGMTRLRLHGVAGRDLELQSSFDFTQWDPVGTNMAVTGGMVLEQPIAGQCFYRVLQH